MNKKFYKEEAIKFGWEGFKKNIWFFLVILLIIFALSLISSAASRITGRAAALGVLLNLASWIISIMVQLGLIKILLKITDGQKPVFDDLFSQNRYFWRYLGAMIVYGLIVLGGLVLLIVPGIIWAIKFQFYKYLIIDKDLGIVESLKKSAEITAGSKWDLFLLALVFLGIIILGGIIFTVGLVVAIPVVMLASAFVYRKLLSHPAPAVTRIP